MLWREGAPSIGRSPPYRPQAAGPIERHNDRLNCKHNEILRHILVISQTPGEAVIQCLTSIFDVWMLTTFMPYACFFLGLTCMQGERKFEGAPSSGIYRRGPNHGSLQVSMRIRQIPRLDPTLNTVIIQPSFPCLSLPAIVDLLERPVLLSPQTSVTWVLIFSSPLGPC